MFYSMADRFGRSYSILLDSSGTGVILVCINIMLPVATDVDIKNDTGTGTDKPLIDLSR